jgi:hypothetical protein
MDVELLVIPDCPHAEPVLQLVLDALAELGLDEVRPRVTVVGSACSACSDRRFAGSPTVLIDGTDPFASPPVSGLACRVYPGPSGLPSPSAVRAALTAAR